MNNKIRILLTNDDGFSAPGFSVIREIIRNLKIDVEFWCLAPNTDRTGMGHSIGWTSPLRMWKVEDKVFTTNGSPVDCVILGINELMADFPPDLVLSGVNDGSNHGSLVFYSGTVGAAREAAMSGFPSIALSQARRKSEQSSSHSIHWDVALAYGPKVISNIIKLFLNNWPKKVIFNVNFPSCDPEDCRGIKITKQSSGSYKHSLAKKNDPWGSNYFWIKSKFQIDDTFKDDAFYLNCNYITISPLCINTTDESLLDSICESSFEKINEGQ